MWFDNNVYKKVMILEQPEGFSEISPNTETTKSFDRNSVLLSKQNWFRVCLTKLNSWFSFKEKFTDQPFVYLFLLEGALRKNK